MIEMTAEQKEEIQTCVRKNFELLSEVVRHETEEREAVKKNLEEFHKALSEREKIIKAAWDKKHSEDLATLEKQLDQLKNFLADQKPE